MPRIDTLEDQMEEMSIPGPGTFKFSAIKPDVLAEEGASEYTLVTICIDRSGSVRSFKGDLLDCIKAIVKACLKSERSENLMLRVLTFSNDLEEVHGFKELHTIDPSTYDDFNPYGGTALYDSAYSGIGASITYAETLINNGFNVNGAVYIVTDGVDNSSTRDAKHIKELTDEALRGEKIESLISILIGLKDPNEKDTYWKNEVTKRLDEFKDEGGLTEYLEVGEVTPQKLAKLAEFVSQSVSSQSNAITTGAPSNPIPVTF